MLLNLWATDQLRLHVEGLSSARQLVNRPAHRLMHLLKQRQDNRFPKDCSCAANVNLPCGATFVGHSVLCHVVRKEDVIKASCDNSLTILFFLSGTTLLWSLNNVSRVERLNGLPLSVHWNRPILLTAI